MKKTKPRRRASAKTPLNWHKTDSQAKRRQAALKSRRGNYLQTARALQQTANRSPDFETRRRARTDAKYFFAKHRQRTQTMRRR